VHHPRFLALFNNVHFGRSGRRLLAFTVACAASPKEEVAKAAASEQENQKTDDQTNDPFAVRLAKRGDMSRIRQDDTRWWYAYLLLVVWAPVLMGPLPIVFEEGNMPVI